MMIIKQVGLFLGFWFLGELIAYLTAIPVPGSIIAMLLLVVALELKILKPEAIKQTANFLLNNMALFFIPAGVGLMCHYELLQKEWLPITIAIVGSALLVLSVVGLIIERRKK